MRRQRISTSCRVLLRAWPMCRAPVTFGGGMTMQNGLRSGRVGCGSSRARSRMQPALLGFLGVVLLGEFDRHRRRRPCHKKDRETSAVQRTRSRGGGVRGAALALAAEALQLGFQLLQPGFCGLPGLSTAARSALRPAWPPGRACDVIHQAIGRRSSIANDRAPPPSPTTGGSFPARAGRRPPAVRRHTPAGSPGPGDSLAERISGRRPAAVGRSTMA